MNIRNTDVLKSRLGDKNYKKIEILHNSYLDELIFKFIELCNPDKVFVCDDSPDDIAYIREQAVLGGEEKKLAIEGHTLHFDGYNDQARDTKNTKFILTKGVDLGPQINAADKEEGIKEMFSLLENSMKGKQLFICFFCLGPTNSEFSLPCVQFTDSAYVAHSQDLLYRFGYEEFKHLGNSEKFFKFVHSAGELIDGKTKNVDKRRIYIDIDDNVVYSVNTQYGGNTIGHKKLAMRLAINKASDESWLTEHMFLMGIHGPDSRVSYFTGAFPSACGKTSTSMLPGERIVGDDIVYLREKQGKIRAVNVEKGMFGIIQGVNSKDDPLIWKALNSPGEIIFSNVLNTDDNNVYWIGKDGKIPERGVNHSGEWTPGKKDAQGNEIPPSHKNARFTLNLNHLQNLDPELDNPDGVIVDGIIFGGRDSATCVPVEEAFDWAHGVISKAASLESETTAAELGKGGVRKFNPMANLSFLSIPLGKYIENYISFGKMLNDPPPIFSVNYFLKDFSGNLLNDRNDKAVWLKWMELRTHKDIGALKTPGGYIPKYDDLKKLFKEVLDKDYTRKDYLDQFSIRVAENLSKIERIMDIYSTKVPDAPDILFKILHEQKKRYIQLKETHGDYVSPEILSE